jgi:hypothetical protein
LVHVDQHGTSDIDQRTAGRSVIEADGHADLTIDRVAHLIRQIALQPEEIRYSRL